MSIASYNPNEIAELDGVAIVAEKPPQRKVLEEEEYCDRMARIIRRDFFPNIQYQGTLEHSGNQGSTIDLNRKSSTNTPGTGISLISSATSSSVIDSTNLKLNDFLNKYTSEDDAYFEKLQRKDLKRHRMKYPWLYRRNKSHSELIKAQKQAPSAIEQVQKSDDGTVKSLADWPYNPRNTLFYPPSDHSQETVPKSTINYKSSSYLNEPVFKAPLPRYERYSHINRLSDRIGIDGKLLNGSETPIINGYSYVPPPDQSPKLAPLLNVKSESNRFYIPSESPRDEIAHRMYQDKVANLIRSPRTGSLRQNTSIRTPGSTKSYADFSFSPGRVKNTPRLKK